MHGEILPRILFTGFLNFLVYKPTVEWIIQSTQGYSSIGEGHAVYTDRTAYMGPGRRRNKQRRSSTWRPSESLDEPRSGGTARTGSHYGLQITPQGSWETLRRYFAAISCAYRGQS